LARGGLYAQLYEIQFKPQLTGALPAAVPEADGDGVGADGSPEEGTGLVAAPVGRGGTGDPAPDRARSADWSRERRQ
jgi:hypothetical protein